MTRVLLGEAGRAPPGPPRRARRRCSPPIARRSRPSGRRCALSCSATGRRRPGGCLGALPGARRPRRARRADVIVVLGIPRGGVHRGGARWRDASRRAARRHRARASSGAPDNPELAIGRAGPGRTARTSWCCDEAACAWLGDPAGLRARRRPRGSARRSGAGEQAYRAGPRRRRRWPAARRDRGRRRRRHRPHRARRRPRPCAGRGPRERRCSPCRWRPPGTVRSIRVAPRWDPSLAGRWRRRRRSRRSGASTTTSGRRGRRGRRPLPAGRPARPARCLCANMCCIIGLDSELP